MRTIGVDTGGTFTDLVLNEDGELRAEKLSSTPADPSRAVIEGTTRLGGAGARGELVHGTTVALNALLTGDTAPVALVTNRRFRDLIEIGRQDRPELYALHPVKPDALVTRERRFEVDQRSYPNGAGLLHERTPTDKELDALARSIRRSGAQSIAVCLLHSYADPSIERHIAERLAKLGLPITCSAELLPAHREFERYSTALVNAALVPRVRQYLERLGAALDGDRLSVLQSSGGTLPAARAALEPARVILSGPAGGVVGAARAAREAGLESIVTLDMGGTSTDVAFHAAHGRLEDAVSSASVAGHPIGLSSLDIHTIGCGGGSIVRVDAGGILRVGPESAGADPGPACYGKGGPLTVTDAHLALGHLAPGSFLGGAMELDIESTTRGFAELAKTLGTKPRRAAEAVLEVARAAMRRAALVMSMQRGKDPSQLGLVAFGGAGGLQAAALADALGLAGALVPRLPGCLSAFGMAHAGATCDHSAAVLAPLADWKPGRRKPLFAQLARDVKAELTSAGYAARRIEFEYGLDLRYEGQSYELTLPETGRELEADFHARHESRYGWQLSDRAVQLVQVRVRGSVRRPEIAAAGGRKRPAPRSARTGTRASALGDGAQVPVIDRESLAPGHWLDGPAVLEEYSGTTLIPAGWRAEVRPGSHLWLTRVGS
jgi:N-methylhydantoinase A